MPERAKRPVMAPTLDSELVRLQRMTQLENAPMRRYTPVPAGACGRESTCPGELLALLSRQNELLCDILGAINALTASRLAKGTAQEDKET